MVAALLVGVACVTPNVDGVYSRNEASTNHETLTVTDSKFRYRMQGCFSGKSASGKVSRQGEMLLLNGTYSEESRPFKLRMYTVAWDGETFLIPDKDMLEFCSTVAEGWQGTDEWWMYRFYRPKPRLGFRPLLGMPVVHASYKRHLFKPFVATTYISEGRLWIDRGSQDGVVEGMVLNDDSRVSPIAVKRVEPFGALCEPLWTDGETSGPEIAGREYKPGMRMMAVQQF